LEPTLMLCNMSCFELWIPCGRYHCSNHVHRGLHATSVPWEMVALEQPAGSCHFRSTHIMFLLSYNKSCSSAQHHTTYTQKNEKKIWGGRGTSSAWLEAHAAKAANSSSWTKRDTNDYPF
jgi:hypothetical protein